MGYRLIIALCALSLMCSCAAFDKDEDHIEGFGPGIDTPDHAEVKQMGPLSGYYAGTMTLSTNSCESIGDALGTEEDFAIDVQQSNTNLLVKFPDDRSESGELNKDLAVFVITEAGVKDVYYLTFTDETVTGDLEVIEVDEEGIYGDSCAKYTISLKKGEKPAEAADDSAEEDTEENEEEETQE